MSNKKYGLFGDKAQNQINSAKRELSRIQPIYLDNGNIESRRSLIAESNRQNMEEILGQSRLNLSIRDNDRTGLLIRESFNPFPLDPLLQLRNYEGMMRDDTFLRQRDLMDAANLRRTMEEASKRINDFRREEIRKGNLF